jgi:DNA-binding beta-propeller fold protein YncE
MTDARHRRFWHSAGRTTALGVLALGATTAGFSCSSDEPEAQKPAGGATITEGAEAPSPFDATPDPDGNILYFTAVGENGPTVFKAAIGGAPAALHEGDPFVSPFGIAISTDGQQLFVSDPGADSGNDLGQLFVLPTAGGAPTALAGTEDTVPRSLEVANEDGQDQIYFTGTNKTDGQPGVFKVSAAGGAVTTVVKGSPLRDPSGIVVAKSGTIFVADTIGSDGRVANIVVVKDGVATIFATGLAVGYPCGIALSTDETTLFVSALDPLTLTDAIAVISTVTGEYSLVSQGANGTTNIGEFFESAGLHRAKNANIFAWADSSAGPAGGKVFVVRLN